MRDVNASLNLNKINLCYLLLDGIGNGMYTNSHMIW